MKMTILKCDVCGREFERCASEVKRNAKRNSKTYCSRSCNGKGNFENFGDNKSVSFNGSKKGEHIDEYSPFRCFLENSKKNVKKRVSKNKDKINSPKNINELTLQDLKEQWETQNGICPFTGWKLKKSNSTSVDDRISHTPDRASLDRIDSSKGYVKDNIQFVALIAQYAKNGWNGDVIRTFCEAVVKKTKVLHK